jgi:ABC-type cobalamin/Fe3+-siderophores transport system ATPase subunit
LQVVLGPQNCGKSALVRAVIKTMQKEYEGHLQPIYIDGRMGGWLVAQQLVVRFPIT